MVGKLKLDKRFGAGFLLEMLAKYMSKMSVSVRINTPDGAVMRRPGPYHKILENKVKASGMSEEVCLKIAQRRGPKGDIKWGRFVAQCCHDLTPLSYPERRRLLERSQARTKYNINDQISRKEAKEMGTFEFYIELETIEMRRIEQAAEQEKNRKASKKGNSKEKKTNRITGGK